MQIIWIWGWGKMGKTGEYRHSHQKPEGLRVEEK